MNWYLSQDDSSVQTRQRNVSGSTDASWGALVTVQASDNGGLANVVTRGWDFHLS